MPPSWRLARNNLLGRRGRTFLVLGAAVIACALIASISSAIASAHATMELALARFLGRSEARIVHQFDGRFDQALLGTVRGWPEVEEAMGYLSTTLTLARPEERATGGPDDAMTVLAIGTEFDLLPGFRELELSAGELPEARHEIVVDTPTAERLEVGVGDRLVLRQPGESIGLVVAAVHPRPYVGFLQQPTIWADRGLVGEAADLPGRLSSIMIRLADEHDVEAFCARHLDEVPQTLALEPAERVRAGFDRQLFATRLGLIIGSLLTFLSAAFIIVIGMTTGVIEQQRELAMIRAVGGTRGQLVRAQLWTGLIVGAAGLSIGLPLGLGIAAALVRYFHDLLPAGLAVSRLGVVLTIAGSLAAGVVGAIYPSWLAGRVTPLEAMTRPARPVRARSIALCIVFAALCLLLGTGLALSGTEDFRFWSYLTVGLPLTFLAYFLLAVPVLVLLIVILHRPLALVLRLPPDLVRGSLLSRPFRHGFTAAALTVGLAIFVDSWTVDQSVMSGWIDRIRFADALAGGVPGLTPKQQRAIAELPFVEDVCPISHTQVRTIDEQVFGIEGVSPPYVQVFGFEPSVFFRMNNIDWLQGDPEAAIPRLETGDAILVADRFLVAHDVGLGDAITLGEGRVQREFEIVGVVSAAGLDIATYLFGIRSAYMEVAISAVFMDFDAAAELFNNPIARLLQVNLNDDVTDEEAERRVLAAAPGIIFFSARWIRDTIEEISDSVLALNSAASLLALLLASLAVATIIVANIRSRRFEYGVLRAVGGHRGLLLRLVLAEGVFIGLTGAIVGGVMGLHFAALDVMFLRDLAGLPIALDVPPRPILLAGAVLLAMTLLAAAPGGIGLLRRTPSALIAAGRNA